MQLSKLWPLIAVTNIIALISQNSWFNPLEKDLKEEEIHYRKIEYSDLLTCKEPNRIWTESMPLNHLGPSLISSNREILTLCPGDSFGDLNETYLVVKNCDLEMYHKHEFVWSALVSSWFGSEDPSEDCALFVQQDGNLILNQHLWSSQTNFKPLQTELRVQDQQFQILQTFKDGTQRLFNLSPTHPKFREYLGEPKKVGGSNFIKSHDDNDTTILRRNEYLGDLDGLHLILQTNCELHLINQSRTIWSFLYSRTLGSNDCSLIIQEGRWISLLRIHPNYEKPQIESLIMLHYGEVIESQFILQNNQLSIIQTLEDGLKFTFESQPGENVGLKLQRKLRQIGQSPVKLRSSQLPFVFQRMDYLGDLNGLHLILQNNCAFMLFNGQERLWQWEYSGGSYMECKVKLHPGNHPSSIESVSRSSYSGSNSGDSSFSNGEIILKNNYAIISGHSKNLAQEFYAGPNTHGEWFLRIPEHSLVLKPQESSHLNYMYHGKAFIGDLNGVYLVISEHDCRWALFNQSQVLWESTKPWYPEHEETIHVLTCHLYLKSNGNITTPQKQCTGEDSMDGITFYNNGDGWFTEDEIESIDTFKELASFEFSLQNDWLYLTQNYVNGTMKKFKALEGTNHFILV